MMDAHSLRPIAYEYVDKESYQTAFPFLSYLKNEGLQLHGITVDGHKKVMDAIQTVWPAIEIQRCLAHIQRQGLMWIRTYPKTQAGKELRNLLKEVTRIQSFQDRDQFQIRFEQWCQRHEAFVRSLPNTSVAYNDLKRTMGLLKNAWPNMFHYLKNKNLQSTTNALESFYSRLKADFQRHRGLSNEHKISYLRWYCYFQSKKKPTLFGY